MLLSAFLGALVGAILGLTGAGGGVLAVPALSVGMGWTMQQAAPVALIAIAISAAVGALEGLRHGLVRYKAAALIALSGFPLVYLGQTLARHLSQALLQAGFACVMLLVGFRLYRHGKAHQSEAAVQTTALARVHPQTGKIIWSVSTAVLLAAIGAATGLMTGLLGVGGGFVIVPLLRRYTQIPIQGIVASSLMVIALVGASGIASALVQHTPIAWGSAAVFTSTTVLGMLLGRAGIRKISARHVQRGFALLLALVALALLWSAAQNLPALAG